MPGKFELKKAKNGKFYFNLKAGNGEIILSSQMYADKRGAKNGIESVRKNSASEDNFEALEDKNGNPFFVLKAKNREVIGKSESYSSKGSIKRGISSVMRNAPESRIQEIDPDADSSFDQLPPITFNIDPGEASPEEIGEFLAEFSKLYRMLGGSGLAFSQSGVDILEVA